MSEAGTGQAGALTIATHIAQALPPLADRIDRHGFYPQAFLRELGRLGGFGAAPDAAAYAPELVRQIDITAQVARECGSTAFLVWCQATCAWYLHHAANDPVRERYLAAVARGELLAGTGMSNTVKHLAGIEKIRLGARRSGDGYVVDGVLPWVSNLGPDHLLMVAAAVDTGGYVMLALQVGVDGMSLHDCPDFSGMQGTRTFNVRFKNVKADAGSVVAQPDQFNAFIERIKAGFVLGQAAIGLGVAEASLRVVGESRASHAHANAFLDDQYDTLAGELAIVRAQTDALAEHAQSGEVPILPVLKLRARASEFALRAANSAVLHAGARGYLMRHPAQRLLREAVFVAIVTPALKQLRQEIHELELKQGQVEAA